MKDEGKSRRAGCQLARGRSRNDRRDGRGTASISRDFKINSHSLRVCLVHPLQLCTLSTTPHNIRSGALFALLRVHDRPSRSAPRRNDSQSRRRSYVTASSARRLSDSIDLESGTRSYGTALSMPEENESDLQGHQNVELARRDDDGGTAARYPWPHPRLSHVRQALLVLVPLGLAAGLLRWPPTVTFFLNFFAIIPLAPSINVSTTRLAATHAARGFGGLLKVILGNAVEIIVRSRSVRDSFSFR